MSIRLRHLAQQAGNLLKHSAQPSQIALKLTPNQFKWLSQFVGAFVDLLVKEVHIIWAQAQQPFPGSIKFHIFASTGVVVRRETPNISLFTNLYSFIHFNLYSHMSYHRLL